MTYGEATPQPADPCRLGSSSQGSSHKSRPQTLATPEDLNALTANVTTIMETVAETKEDMTAVQEDMKATEDRLTTRLGRIENLLLAKQEQRLDDLKARMKKLEDALAV